MTPLSAVLCLSVVAVILAASATLGAWWAGRAIERQRLRAHYRRELRRQLAGLAASYDRLLTDIGTALLPHFEALAVVMTRVADQVSAWADEP